MEELYNRVNYLAPIDFLINSYIREYDLSKANITALFTQGIINRSQYDYFYSLPKKDREYKIGWMQIDNLKIANAIKEGILLFRKQFFEANNIKDSDVLSIKNDAIFLIDKKAEYTTFGVGEFKIKNEYTSFYRINKLELYYYYDYITQKESLDIKGIDDEKIAEYHDKYFADFLKCVFNSAQLDPIVETIDLLNDFHDSYVSEKLEIGYYREFNANSNFLITAFPFRNTIFYANTLDERHKHYLDKSFNENILRILRKIYLSLYFS